MAWHVFKIVAGWWGHQPGQSCVGGVLTAHSHECKATILNAPKGLQFPGEIRKQLYLLFLLPKNIHHEAGTFLAIHLYRF